MNASVIKKPNPTASPVTRCRGNNDNFSEFGSLPSMVFTDKKYNVSSNEPRSRHATTNGNNGLIIDTMPCATAYSNRKTKESTIISINTFHFFDSFRLICFMI